MRLRLPAGPLNSPVIPPGRTMQGRPGHCGFRPDHQRFFISFLRSGVYGRPEDAHTLQIDPDQAPSPKCRTSPPGRLHAAGTLVGSRLTISIIFSPVGKSQMPSDRTRSGTEEATLRLKLGDIPKFCPCYDRVKDVYRSLPWQPRPSMNLLKRA